MKRHPGLLESVRHHTARSVRRATWGALGWWAWCSEGGLRSPGRRGQDTRTERSRRGHQNCAERNRRGSTLLVVMALLGMLLLLGMLYLTFSSQEQANATYFAEAAKQIDPGDDIDAIFDQAMKQLILGADTSQKNSVLGYRSSMLGTYFGKDLQPFSGTGVDVALTGSGLAATPVPAGYDLLEVNDSPAAQRNPSNGQPLFERDLANMPASDVDYTYPDINNMFLAFKTYVWDPNDVDPTGKPKRKLILKPSFHRPELLRDNSLAPIPDWATYTGGSPSAPFSTRARLMRPHPDHLYVWQQNTNLPPERRFLDDYNPADAALIAGLACQRGFPFHNVPPLPNPVPATPVPRRQGVWSQTGPGAAPAYEYDTDNDGDGVPEGIWMDLDLPVRERPSDSKTYLPLISFTVYDLDALLNLNIHGNLSGDHKTSPTTNFGNNNDISRSSMGLGPNEVNPLHALEAIPGADIPPITFGPTSDYARYFSHNPANQRELANMEFWWLLTGRFEWPVPPSTAAPQVYSGRHGEANRLWRVYNTAGGSGLIGVNQYGAQGDYFPFAGVTYTDDATREGGDDNRDENEGRESWLGGSSVGVTEPFVHPLALGGRGRFWGAAGGANFKRLLASTGGLAGNPTRWIGYDGMGVGYDRNNNLVNANWYYLLGGNLMANTLIGANYKNPALGSDEQLVHDTLEITLEPKYLQRPYDEPLESLESIWLHMSSSDRSLSGLQSRVEHLMPSNLLKCTQRDPNLPHEIAQRFTADSWDIKQFALMNSPDPATLAVTPRTWEWNVDFDADGLPEFPPQFNPPANLRPDVTSSTSANAYAALDPFRPQLRRLLSVEFGNTKDIRHAMRLSINEFLDVERQPSTVANPYTSPLQYRALTPHITTVPTTPITALPHPIAVTPAPTAPFSARYELPPYPPGPYTDSLGNTFSQDAVREFWARRDRQQMARDIYVMLYTFCGGNDSVNVTTVAGDTAYSAEMRRQMAQFAVNLVDALDRDNIITAFEYDTNLANGWGLDDDPFAPTSNDLQAGDRRVVFGVEAQELTFSEVAWFRQKEDSTDHPLTPFNETAGDHHFIHIELRSVSPQNVELAKTISTEKDWAIWRIHRDDNDDGKIDGDNNGDGKIDMMDMMGMGMGDIENAMYFLFGSGSSAPPSLTVAPGSLYTIASADANTVGVASLYVDHAGASTNFELVSPNKAGAPAYSSATGTPNPVANLDLLHTNHAGYFGLATDGMPTTTPGDFLSRNNAPSPGMGMGMGSKTHLRLDRRLNPNLPTLSLAENPFVTVDKFKGVDRIELEIDSTVTTQAQAATELSDPGRASQERRQSLEGEVNVDSGGAAPSIHRNTLTQNNQSSPNPFSLLHTHFDRDFASVIELLDLPLCGPDELTRIVTRSRLPASVVTNSDTYAPFSFGRALFALTEDRNANGMLEGSEDVNGNGILDSNHFHRFLSLVETPTRTHRQLGDPLKLNRVPGRLNLNTLRDRQVLAALIDDREVVVSEMDTNRNKLIDLGEDLNGDGRLGLVDATGDTGRDWWEQFLEARDQLDPVTGLPLPMSGISRPFRDLANLTARTIAAGASPLDDTFLRRMPVGNSAAGRRLFELANEAEFALLEDVNGNGTFDANDPNEDVNMNGVFDGADDKNGNGVFDASVDPVIRHRLLSKMIGNTTTRSNVFVVFVTIGMFECVELPNGAVRVGGQMDVDNDGTPDTHRAVFIVDRSTAEEAYDKGSGTFDWKKLILAKQRVN